MVNEEFVIHERKYILSVDNDKQFYSLRRYNEKVGMWVKMNFLINDEQEQKEIDKRITYILSEEYLSTYT